MILRGRHPTACWAELLRSLKRFSGEEDRHRSGTLRLQTCAALVTGSGEAGLQRAGGTNRTDDGLVEARRCAPSARGRVSAGGTGEANGKHRRASDTHTGRTRRGAGLVARAKPYRAFARGVPPGRHHRRGKQHAGCVSRGREPQAGTATCYGFFWRCTFGRFGVVGLLQF